MLCSSRISEKFTTTWSRMGSTLKRLPPRPGIMASISRTWAPQSTSFAARLLPTKPRPPVTSTSLPSKLFLISSFTSSPSGEALGLQVGLDDLLQLLHPLQVCVAMQRTFLTGSRDGEALLVVDKVIPDLLDQIVGVTIGNDL